MAEEVNEGKSMEEAGEAAQKQNAQASQALATGAAVAGSIGDSPEKLKGKSEDQQKKADKNDQKYKNAASNGDFKKAEKAHKKSQKAQGKADKLKGKAEKAKKSKGVGAAKDASKAMGAASMASGAASKLAGQLAGSGDTGDATASGAALAGSAVKGAAKGGAKAISKATKKLRKAANKLIPLSVKLIIIAVIAALLLFAAIAATLMQSVTVFLSNLVQNIESAISGAKNILVKAWKNVTEAFTDLGKTVAEVRENPTGYAASLTDQYFEKAGDKIRVYKMAKDSLPEGAQVDQSTLEEMAESGDYDSIVDYYATLTQCFLDAAYAQVQTDVGDTATDKADPEKAASYGYDTYDAYDYDRTMATMPDDPFQSPDLANIMAAYSVTDDLATASVARYEHYIFGMVTDGDFLSYDMEELCEDRERYSVTETFYWSQADADGNPTGTGIELGSYTIVSGQYEEGSDEEESYKEAASSFASGVSSALSYALTTASAAYGADDGSGASLPTAGITDEVYSPAGEFNPPSLPSGFTEEYWDFSGLNAAIASSIQGTDGAVGTSMTTDTIDCKLWWDQVTITPYAASDVLSFLDLDPDATWEGSEDSDGDGEADEDGTEEADDGSDASLPTAGITNEVYSPDEEDTEDPDGASYTCTNEEAYLNYYKTLKDELEQIGYSCTSGSVSSTAYGTVLTESEIEEYLDALPEGTSGNRREIIKVALNAVGRIPYCNVTYNKYPSYGWSMAWGEPSGDTKHPYKGLDCSGFVQWVYRNALCDEGGDPCSESYKNLGSTAAISTGGGCRQLYAAEEHLPGDLGLLFVGGSSGDTWNHVGIYIGDGLWVHCSGSKGTVVVTENPGFTVYFRVEDDCLEDDNYAKEGTLLPFLPTYAAIGQGECDLSSIATVLDCEFSADEGQEGGIDEGFRCCAEAVYHYARYSRTDMSGAIQIPNYLQAYTYLNDGTLNADDHTPTTKELEIVQEVMDGKLIYFPASAYPYPVMYFNTDDSIYTWASKAVRARTVTAPNGVNVSFFYVPNVYYDGYGT